MRLILRLFQTFNFEAMSLFFPSSLILQFGLQTAVTDSEQRAREHLQNSNRQLVLKQEKSK
jgi:hypothetical protein